MYDTQVELFKGEDSVAFDEVFDDPGDRELTAVLYKSLPVLESGKAERIVVYLSKDGDLLEIIDVPAKAYDPKEMYTNIESLKERYAGR